MKVLLIWPFPLVSWGLKPIRSKWWNWLRGAVNEGAGQMMCANPGSHECTLLLLSDAGVGVRLVSWWRVGSSLPNQANDTTLRSNSARGVGWWCGGNWVTCNLPRLTSCNRVVPEHWRHWGLQEASVAAARLYSCCFGSACTSPLKNAFRKMGYLQLYLKVYTIWVGCKKKCLWTGRAIKSIIHPNIYVFENNRLQVDACKNIFAD